MESDPNQTPAGDVKNAALAWLLGIVRGVTLRHSDDIDVDVEELLVEMDRAVEVYDALCNKQLDDDERAALELEVERTWLDAFEGDNWRPER